ncbi:MAG: hypothetical protein ACK5Y6_03200 [Pseudomonadota bacterium]
MPIGSHPSCFSDLCFRDSSLSWLKDEYPEYQQWLDESSPVEVLDTFKGAKQVLERARSNVCEEEDIVGHKLLQDAVQSLEKYIQYASDKLSEQPDLMQSHGMRVVSHFLQEIDLNSSDLNSFRVLMNNRWVFQGAENDEQRIAWSGEALIMMNKLSIFRSLLSDPATDDTETFAG